MTGKCDIKRYRGGCLCGAVTFEVALPATLTAIWHIAMPMAKLTVNHIVSAGCDEQRADDACEAMAAGRNLLD